MKLLPVLFLLCLVFTTVLPTWSVADETVDTYKVSELENTGMDEAKDLLLSEGVELSWKTTGKNLTIRPDHPLNPEESFFNFNRKEITTDFDLEWNPKLTDSLSFRSRGVASYQNLEETSETKAFFLEGYFQWRNEKQTFVTSIGKVRVEWGSGYAWHPTQVLIPIHEDSTNDIEEKEGLEMLQVEYVTGLLTSTIILGSLAGEKVEENKYQVAAKLSANFEPWEVSLVHHQAFETAATNGLSFTGLVTDSLEVHGEWTVAGKRDRTTVQKAADGIQMGPSYLPARYEYVDDNQDQFFDRVLLGGQYTFSNNVNIILEYYHTTHGYDHNEWETVKSGVKEALREDAYKNPDSPFTTAQGNPYAGFLKNTMAVIGDEEVRQNYLFFRLTSGETENLWEWEQILMLNLDDQSQVHQGILHKSWFGFLKARLEITFFRGDTYSEFGLNPYSETYELSVNISF